MTRGDPLDRRGPPEDDEPDVGGDGGPATEDARGRDEPPGSDGELHVYTGNGKGKTTAAVGAALRAAGHGWRVHVVQFMKGDPFPTYGEIDAVGALDGVTVEQHPVRHLVEPGDVREEDREAVAAAMTASREALYAPAGAGDAALEEEGAGETSDRGAADEGAASPAGAAADARYDLVVLDEVNVACHFGLADGDAVVAMLDQRRAPYAVCTGRYAPDALVEAADLVTRMEDVRHPRGSDGPALEGIDW